MAFEDTTRAVSFQHVRISSDFWLNRIEATRTGSLPAMYEQMRETGRWDVLKLKWKQGDPNKPHRFWDSDVAKWLEAACYSLVLHPDAALARLVEEAVDNIRGAQQKDGYLNSYYTVVEPGKRWTNIAWSHEMYCAGHLLEAAVAHHIYSHSTRLLGPMLRYIDHIRSTFGLSAGQKPGYPGHQEFELALLKCYEHLSADAAFSTQDTAPLLELANYLIEERGQPRPEGHYYDIEARARGEKEAVPGPMPRGAARFSYYQADRRLREMQSVEGHSVRVMYWLTGVANLARLTRDESMLAAAERLWQSTMRKMYVTGGLGAMGEWEGFGPDYFLPNETGYLETCAAIGLVLFAHQMLRISPRVAEYGSVMELALYNAVLVGMSLDGKSFFYDNPTATIGTGYGRSDWFEVSCCPPNVARLVNSLGKYIYTVGEDDTVHVHLYISSFVDLELGSGAPVRVRQTASSPWDAEGRATFVLEGMANKDVKLSLRRPNGAQNFHIMAGAAIACTPSACGNFIEVVARADSSLNTKPRGFTLRWSYAPRRLHAHPLTLDNRACVAFARGPFVYCAESADNACIGDLRAVRVRDDAPVEEVCGSSAFERWGVRPVLLSVPASVEGGEEGEEVRITLVPLFMWANRGKSEMRTWLGRA